MKKLHFGALTLAFALFGTALSGCAAADGGRNFIPGGEAATGEAGVDGGGGAMPSDPGDTGDAGDVSDGVQTVPAGQLTAGAWDDNADYSFFKGLFETSVTIACGEQGSEEAEPGLFAAYLPGEDRKNAWGMSVLNRVEVTVTDGEGNPAAGAKVVLEGEGESLAAFSGADGKAYLFPQTADLLKQFRAQGTCLSLKKSAVNITGNQTDHMVPPVFIEKTPRGDRGARLSPNSVVLPPPRAEKTSKQN